MRRGEGRNSEERRQVWEGVRSAPDNDSTVHEMPYDDASDTTGKPAVEAGGRKPQDMQQSGRIKRTGRWLSDHALESVFVAFLVALMLTTIGLAGKIGRVEGQIVGLKEGMDIKLEAIEGLLTRIEPDVKETTKKLHGHDLAIQENKLRIENLTNMLAEVKK